MKNLKIKILIGIPASGKTTWSKDFLRKNWDWVRICRDDYRYMLRNEPFCTPKIESMITEMVKKDTFLALSKKLNVVLDATHVKITYINDIIDTFKYYADIDYQIFDISLSKAIERDENRDEKVGNSVIKRMYKNYKDLIDSFHFQPVVKQHKPHIKPNFGDLSLPQAIIVDLDGTLAHMNYKRGPFDWHKVDMDDVNEIVKEQINFHHRKGRNIIILTGRDGAALDKTKEWLAFYEIPHSMILTREKNDNRKDTIVKKELYDNNIKGKYNVLCVYDDRLQVLDMWNKEGLFTFNVNQGNIPF